MQSVIGRTMCRTGKSFRTLPDKRKEKPLIVVNLATLKIVISFYAYHFKNTAGNQRLQGELNRSLSGDAITSIANYEE